jgi:DNA-binding NarL/FixJ family response regulator
MATQKQHVSRLIRLAPDAQMETLVNQLIEQQLGGSSIISAHTTDARLTALVPTPQLIILAALINQDSAIQPVQVAILARCHLALAWLRQIIAGVSSFLPLIVHTTSTQRTPVVEAIRTEGVDLLICTPDALADAAQIAEVHGVPLLVYTSVADAPALRDSQQSIVVGPTTAEELACAMQQTLQGEPYQNPQVAAVLGLSPRQQTIITMLRRGATTAQIAAAVGLSAHWLRHVISDLYDQLGIVHSRAALIQWGQNAPLYLLEA